MAKYLVKNSGPLKGEVTISGAKNSVLPIMAATLLADDLRFQPETLVITAEYCPLRDEGEEYGRRLRMSGNKVKILRIKDALHGYMSLRLRFKMVRKTYELIASFLEKQ